MGTIEEMIAAERDMIGKQLDEALARRDAANADVKELRAKLDAAPRLHVRRTRKARVASLVEDSGYRRADADLELTSGGEMPVAELELTSGGEIKVRRL